MTGCVDKRNAYRPVPGDEVSFTTCSACLARTRFPDSRPKFPDLVVINIVQICRNLVISAGHSPGSHTPGTASSFARGGTTVPTLTRFGAGVPIGRSSPVVEMGFGIPLVFWGATFSSRSGLLAGCRIFRPHPFRPSNDFPGPRVHAREAATLIFALLTFLRFRQPFPGRVAALPPAPRTSPPSCLRPSFPPCTSSIPFSFSFPSIWMPQRPSP